eukprot:GHVS01062189.1.p1 GENE.GHVS01062189.1~~GHVS01062189.1.p1  ORF type:complete len:314 (+),score=26.68 GHVS01062189.1:110-943(+)
MDESSSSTGSVSDLPEVAAGDSRGQSSIVVLARPRPLGGNEDENDSNDSTLGNKQQSGGKTKSVDNESERLSSSDVIPIGLMEEVRACVDNKKRGVECDRSNMDGVCRIPIPCHEGEDSMQLKQCVMDEYREAGLSLNEAGAWNLTQVIVQCILCGKTKPVESKSVSSADSKAHALGDAQGGDTSDCPVRDDSNRSDLLSRGFFESRPGVDFCSLAICCFADVQFMPTCERVQKWFVKEFTDGKCSLGKDGKDNLTRMIAENLTRMISRGGLLCKIC